MECHFLHSKEVSEYVHHRLRLTGFDENTDLDSLFKDIKEIFFYPERERWINMQNLLSHIASFHRRQEVRWTDPR